MANFNNLSLTVSGIKALLEAQEGKTLVLSKIGLGSGYVTSGITNLKALVTPKLMIPISETSIDSDQGYMTVIANMTNESMTEGFYWKETGLFFKDESGSDVLFAYACITDDKYDYIPAYSDQRYVKNIRIANVVTNTANITVEESDGLVYVDTVTFNAFKGEIVKYDDVVDNLLSDASNLPLSAKQGKVLQEQVTELNTDIPYKIVVKDFRNVYTETNKGYITMNPSDFGLTHLSLVIAQHNTVPNGKILTGFYSNGTTQYIGVYNPDGSLYDGIIDFTAVAFGT